MYMPSFFGESLFDEWMGAQLAQMNQIDHALYGKHADHVMKTDVKENENGYEVEMDLPGFKKENISAKLENGYLTISAAKSADQGSQNQEGKYIRRERYTGQCSRTFYVGKEMTQEDIHAKFEDGILKLTVPKKDQKQAEQKKYIAIEG